MPEHTQFGVSPSIRRNRWFFGFLREARVSGRQVPRVPERPLSPFPFPLSPFRLRSTLALFCACMVLFAATLRLAHTHTPAEQESGHCPICVAIHTGIPTASAPVQVILHAAPEPIVTPAPKAPAKARVEVLSDRAPPANV